MMKIILSIISMLLSVYSFSEESINRYTIDQNGNVDIIVEHNYSKIHSFKNYTIRGTFEDNLGNYGSSDGTVVAEYKDGKVINLQWSSKLTYQNNKVIFLKV